MSSGGKDLDSAKRANQVALETCISYCERDLTTNEIMVIHISKSICDKQIYSGIIYTIVPINSNPISENIKKKNKS